VSTAEVAAGNVITANGPPAVGLELGINPYVVIPIDRPWMIAAVDTTAPYSAVGEVASVIAVTTALELVVPYALFANEQAGIGVTGLSVHTLEVIGTLYCNVCEPAVSDTYIV
jgi:hypothetical protein